MFVINCTFEGLSLSVTLEFLSCFAGDRPTDPLKGGNVMHLKSTRDMIYMNGIWVGLCWNGMDGG